MFVASFASRHLEHWRMRHLAFSNDHALDGKSGIFRRKERSSAILAKCLTCEMHNSARTVIIGNQQLFSCRHFLSVYNDSQLH